MTFDFHAAMLSPHYRFSHSTGTVVPGSGQFSRPGTHLVICPFLPHFDDEMYGWVKVVN